MLECAIQWLDVHLCIAYKNVTSGTHSQWSTINYYSVIIYCAPLITILPSLVGLTAGRPADKI